jgi:hypothetical protein
MFIELLIRIRNSCDENNFQSEVYDEIIRFTSNPERRILTQIGHLLDVILQEVITGSSLQRLQDFFV